MHPESAKSKPHQSLGLLVGELWRELVAVAIIYLPVVALARTAVLILHARGERQASVPISGPFDLSVYAYYIEDIQSFFWVAGLCLAVGLVLYHRIFWRQAAIAQEKNI